MWEAAGSRAEWKPTCRHCRNQRGGMQRWAAQPLTRVLPKPRRSNLQLVEAHGGSISVASRRGKGSVFTFTLRVRAALGWAHAGLFWARSAVGWAHAGLFQVLCTCRAVAAPQPRVLTRAVCICIGTHPGRCMHMRMEAPPALSPHSSGARWRWLHRRRPMRRRRSWTRCGALFGSCVHCVWCSEMCVPQWWMWFDSWRCSKRWPAQQHSRCMRAAIMSRL